MKSILLNQLADKLSGMGVTSVITDDEDDIFLTADNRSSPGRYYQPATIMLTVFDITDFANIKIQCSVFARDQFETRWKK